ncbi:MAG: sterol-binding protein [Nitrococcus mobilis]|nr:sterol-binding protein [Nitrococcus mobilis]
MAFTALAQPVRETLLHVIEAAVNRLLAADPASPRRLRELAGYRLGVELTDLELNFLLLFSETGLRFVPPTSVSDAPAPAARIRGSFLGLLGPAISADRRGTQVEFSGDVGVAEDARRLFTDLEVDWEEQLAQLTGDIVAHQLGQAIRGSTTWLRRSGKSVLQTLGEYFTEERRDLPAAAEVSIFLTEVDCLHRDVEQLAARVRRLQQSLDCGAGR